MTAAKRRRTNGNEPHAVPHDERQAVLHRDFRHDLAYWIGSHPRLALRIMRLIEEIIRDPFSGLGKPEPLRHGLVGRWSRRITEEDRLEYSVSPQAVHFRRARFHYPS
ncbi:Txe/YoeB family addiction module toxin [Longimicrobium sp.]|uniref:Txe/YoeB family addiction module toxin n=1 Tax=Longimicrobium sp. TaxID=2029185 RepID=UPI003B3B5B8B